MSYEKLKEYVIDQKKAGVSEGEIRDALNKKEWHSELIDKAMTEVFPEDEEMDIKSIKGLIKGTWNNFKNHAANYILASLLSSVLPIIPVLLFSIPIIYDIAALGFTVNDFTSPGMLPLMSFYLFVCLILTIVMSLQGSLLLIVTVAHNGNIKVGQAFKKAWQSLPGYIWISVLIALITSASIIPSMILAVLASYNIVPDTYTFVVLGFAMLLAIPCVLLSLFFAFSPFAYIVHGARGRTALRSSFNLVRNNFKWIVVRLLALWVIIVISEILINVVPLLGILVNLIVTPVVLIYMFKIYKNGDGVVREEMVKENEVISE